MTQLESLYRDQWGKCFIPRPTQKPADWVCENVVFNEPEYRGRYLMTGREYSRDVLNDFADRSIHHEVWVKGSQLGGTSTIMAGCAWKAANDPRRFLWVYPSGEIGDSFSSTRWIPMLEATRPTADLIPTGARRHGFKTSEQRLGASIFNFTGSNSAAGLSSIPCGCIILDEVDKYGQTGGGNEADPVDLAEQRTKNAVDPQTWEFSTPTLVDGFIWRQYLKGNQMRYEVPCPLCSKRVLLAWSAEYTILAKTGREAYVVWDKEAKRPNGQWDLDRVERSARFRCSHCAGDIEDSKKTWMVRDGVWVPTNLSAAKGFVSRHTSSLYACRPQTTCGKLAVKFLEKKQSLEGLQGFINGDLAEPYQSQDTQGQRTERIVERIEIKDDSTILLTGDAQRTRFWTVAGLWVPGKLTIIEASPQSTVEDIRAQQVRLKVKDVGVMIDSGYGARSVLEIYKQCARFGEVEDQDHPKLPIHCGWMPSKGMPTTRRWKDAETGAEQPYHLQPVDPFLGTADAGQMEMSLFEFSGEYFKDILDRMRKGKTQFVFEVTDEVAKAEYQIDGKTETFWQHMDGEHKVAVHNQRTGFTTYEWRLKAKYWPNHLLDCVVEQVALAAFFGLIKIE